MKCTVFVCLIFLGFTSCIDDVDHAGEDFPQQWQLVRMSNSQTQSEKSGVHMDWQEFYLLKEDGTFLKSRLRNGAKISATGTYLVEETEDETRVIFTYDAPSDIIGSCSTELQESLVVVGNDLLIGTWWACDGPGLEYRRFQ